MRLWNDSSPAVWRIYIRCHIENKGARQPYSRKRDKSIPGRIEYRHARDRVETHGSGSVGQFSGLDDTSGAVGVQSAEEL